MEILVPSQPSSTPRRWIPACSSKVIGQYGSCDQILVSNRSRPATWPVNWSSDENNGQFAHIFDFCFLLDHWKLLCGLNCHDLKVQQPIGEATTIKASVKISNGLLLLCCYICLRGWFNNFFLPFPLIPSLPLKDFTGIKKLLQALQYNDNDSKYPCPKWNQVKNED